MDKKVIIVFALIILFGIFSYFAFSKPDYKLSDIEITEKPFSEELYVSKDAIITTYTEDNYITISKGLEDSVLEIKFEINK